MPLQGNGAGQNRLQRGAGVCKNRRRIKTVTKGKDRVGRICTKDVFDENASKLKCNQIE